MKVLQVLPGLDAGGVERGTLDMAAALVAAGHESHVASAGGRLVSRLTRHGSTHHEWDLGAKSPLTLRKVRPFRRWLAAEGVDIVHLRSRMPGWINWLAWRRMPKATRPRLVSTVHGAHSVSRYSEIVTYGERVIVVSESIRDYVLKNYPRCSPDKLRLIYRGINPLEFPHQHRPSDHWLSDWYREHPQLLDRRVITLPGRLTRLKGHHEFFAIISALKNQGVAAHGLIVGGEDPKRLAYARELYASVDDQGLGGDITFAGHRDDLRDIYAVSDVVLVLENAWNSVISPEGCAAILWKDRAKAKDAASALKVSAQHVKEFEIADAIIPEPLGGAHHDPQSVFDALRKRLNSDLKALQRKKVNTLLDHRYKRYRKLGPYAEAGV